MKKIYVAVIASAFGFAFMLGGSRLRAQAHFMGSPGIPLYQLAGGFAGEGAANYGVCFNDDFSATQDCSITPDAQVATWIDNFTYQGTSDTLGNSCGEEFETNGPFFPGPQAANINDYIVVGALNSYNPATGSGNNTFTAYVAGPGISCNGSQFVNTANATAVATTTGHFVVSNNGNRVDEVTLTAKSLPVNFLSDFVGHSFALRQTPF
jgi:hypothetical protein